MPRSKVVNMRRCSGIVPVASLPERVSVRLNISVLGAMVIAAGAQAVSQQDQTFRASTRIVPISVVVHDRSGKPVEGLTAADFRIMEDGVERPVALFAVESRLAVRPSAPIRSSVCWGPAGWAPCGWAAASTGASRVSSRSSS